MSNLLEEAIIDATALKQAALKNAQAALEEKYSQELKESVEKLLEAEPVGPAPDPMTAASPDTVGTMPADAMLSPSIGDIGGSGTVDPMAGGPSPSPGKSFAEIPASFLDGPDDELITINFDEIKKEVKEMLGGEEEQPELSTPEASEQPVEPTEAQPEESQPQALEEEIELDENILLEMSCGSSYKKNKDDLEEDMTGGSNEDPDSEALEEYLELEEEMPVGQIQDPNVAAKNAEETRNKKIKELEDLIKQLELKAKTGDLDKKNLADAKTQLAQLKSGGSPSLEEEMEVDTMREDDPSTLRNGYLRTSAKEQQLQFDAALARIAKELNEEIQIVAKENVDLNKKLQKNKEINITLANKLDNYKEAFFELKEELQKLSISNAKLIYTNKVLSDASLNERQKQTVVESLSRSKSINEAKTIFETLQSTVQSVSEKKPRESLSEAINRGPSPFAIRNRQPQIDDNLSERMKILAGIK